MVIQGIPDEARIGPRRPRLEPKCLNVARPDIEMQERRPMTAKTTFKTWLKEKTRRYGAGEEGEQSPGGKGEGGSGGGSEWRGEGAHWVLVGALWCMFTGT